MSLPHLLIPIDHNILPLHHLYTHPRRRKEKKSKELGGLGLMTTTSSESGPLVNLSVKSQDDKVLYFKIARDKPLKILLMQYCERMAIEYMAMRFLLVNGNRLPANQTPDQLNLEDGDEILAMRHMMGGSC